MCGVFLLSWEGGDILWLGKSRNIHSTYKRHCNSNSPNFSGTPVREVQKAISKYGMPSLELLAPCTEQVLDKKYKFFLEKYKDKIINK